MAYANAADRYVTAMRVNGFSLEDWMSVSRFPDVSFTSYHVRLITHTYSTSNHDPRVTSHEPRATSYAIRI